MDIKNIANLHKWSRGKQFHQLFTVKIANFTKYCWKNINFIKGSWRKSITFVKKSCKRPNLFIKGLQKNSNFRQRIVGNTLILAKDHGETLYFDKRLWNKFEFWQLLLKKRLWKKKKWIFWKDCRKNTRFFKRSLKKCKFCQKAEKKKEILLKEWKRKTVNRSCKKRIYLKNDENTLNLQRYLDIFKESWKRYKFLEEIWILFKKNHKRIWFSSKYQCGMRLSSKGHRNKARFSLENHIQKTSRDFLHRIAEKNVNFVKKLQKSNFCKNISTGYQYFRQKITKKGSIFIRKSHTKNAIFFTGLQKKCKFY